MYLAPRRDYYRTFVLPSCVVTFICKTVLLVYDGQPSGDAVATGARLLISGGVACLLGVRRLSSKV